MIYYELVKIIIDALGLIEIIIDMIICHYSLAYSIVTNKDSFFTSKFWSLLCYFLDIKYCLFIALHLQTDGQIERQKVL